MLKQRHFLSLSDYSSFDLKLLLDTADEMKKHPKPFRKALKGQILSLIFERPCLRTRLSFETGMHHLGGTTQVLSGEDIRLDQEEPIADTAALLSCYVDGILVRTRAHQTVLALAEHGTVPVINGQTDLEHPCQALADLQTLREQFGRLEGLKLTYIGDGKHMAQALLHGTARTGMDCTLILPGAEAYQCRPEVLQQAREAHGAQGTRLHLTEDLNAARGSHVIYTDAWGSGGPEATRTARLEALQGYAVTQSVMELAGPNAVFMHCLPAHRGSEVMPEVIDGPRSLVHDQAGNRLWAQMAVLYHLLGEG